MQDRYHLTRDENVFLAKKHWSESIFSGMRMENRNVTFPQTQTILNGINVAGVSLSDVQAILNMRDAWRYLLDIIDSPLSIDLLCEIQARVAFREALVCGKLRTGAVGISGVRYVPPIPVELVVEKELLELLQGKAAATEKALALFAWLARKQLFWDGNKRTAILAANKVLIEHGAGVLIVPDRHMLTFNALLAEFYESDNADALTEFLYTQAIIGIEYEATDEEPEAEPASSAEGETSAAAGAIAKHSSVWLKKQRGTHGITQRELAQAVGLNVNSIANIEQGQRKGSPATWQILEEFFGD